MGQTQHHGVTVGDEDIAHIVRAWAGREQRKAAPEERMGGISDLDFRRVVYRWVVDRGIKMYGRMFVLRQLEEADEVLRSIGRMELAGRTCAMLP